MKFISVRELKGKSGMVWKDLDRQGNLVVTNNGKPMALLCRVREEELEETLEALQQAKARLAIDRLRAQAKAKGIDRWSMEQVDTVVAKTRKAGPR
jgi:PHD/YefM family antitoxin component YafN of YafNO toxin-antitoxin module